MNGRSTKVYVDSISGVTCRLLAGDDARTLIMPVEFLPEGAAEGCVLQMTLTEAPEETEEARAGVEALLESLGDNI